MDWLEWKENAVYLGYFFEEIIEDLEDNDEVNFLINDTVFLNQLVNIFLFIHKKFLLFENLPKYIPLFLFTKFFLNLSGLSSFKYICFKRNLHKFLVENCLFNEHFDLNFLQNAHPIKLCIYEKWIIFLKLIIKEKNYYNKNLYQGIKKEIESGNLNSENYIINVNLANILIYLKKNVDDERNPIDICFWIDMIYELKEWFDLPKFCQILMKNRIIITFQIIQDIGNLNMNIDEFIDDRYDFLKFLKNSHSCFHESILNCIENFLKDVYFDKIPDKIKFILTLRKIDYSSFDLKIKERIKKLIFDMNLKILSKFQIKTNFEKDKNSFTKNLKNFIENNYFSKIVCTTDRNQQKKFLWNFITWTKDDWCNNYHFISNIQVDIINDLMKNSLSNNYFTDLEFGDNLIKLFKRFHQLFFNENYNINDNHTFFPLYFSFLNLYKTILNYSEPILYEFFEKKCLEMIYSTVFNHPFFSFENNKISFHFLKYFKYYLGFFFKICKYHNPKIRDDLINLGFINHLKNLQKFLGKYKLDEEKDSEEFQKYFFDLQIQCFISHLPFIQDENDENLIISSEFFYFLKKNLENNLSEIIENDFYLNNEDLFYIFLILSKSPKNYCKLHGIFHIILEYLEENYDEKIKIFAATCIFSFINNEKYEISVMDEFNLLEVFSTHLNINSEKVEYLIQNISYELFLRIDKDVESEEHPIVFSYHLNDDRNVSKIINFFTTLTGYSNILISNSKCNFFSYRNLVEFF